MRHFTSPISYVEPKIKIKKNNFSEEVGTTLPHKEIIYFQISEYGNGSRLTSLNNNAKLFRVKYNKNFFKYLKLQLFIDSNFVLV